jgi:hypothetical protein
MGQLGFFDADNRLTALSAKGDPLEAIDRLVPWESFRGDIEAAVLTLETERKSTAGRKPIDAIVLFRMLILQSLYNLSDAMHKLIRRYDVSDAAVHDSQKLDALLNKANRSADVFADSAYRSAEAEARLKARGFRSRILVRATRNHPLSRRQEEANRKKSKIRVRIEHVFGAQETSAGSRLVRTIGIVRARAKIGLQNLVYNVRRLVTLERIATA